MEGKRFGIRSMEIHDLEDVESIETASSLTPWSSRMFREEMGNPYTFCFVMTSRESSRDRVISYICFRNIGDESELLNICVHPDYRAGGCGRELMHFYTDLSLQRGTKTFHLEVNHANQPAVRLYRSFSYRSVGVRSKFYRGEVDALRMMRQV